MFSVEERVGFLEEALRDQDNVEVDVFSELVVEFAKRWGAKTMVKGLRVISDFEWEFQMNHLNRTLAPDVETVYSDVEPAVQLRLVERREGGRLVRRQRRRAGPGAGRAPLQGDVPRRQARRAGLSSGMKNKRRNLILVAGLVALVAVGAAVAVGFALGGDHDHKPRYPGRIAVRDGCGLVHFFQDGSDQKTHLPHGRLGCGQPLLGREEARLGHEGDGNQNRRRERGERVHPLGAAGRERRPEPLARRQERWRSSTLPRDDGRYDIWVGDVDANNAEQVTNTRNVSDVAWSPKGDWLAYVKDWSDETLEGQISLVRPDGDDDKTLVRGDTPEWAPDGKHLVYVHNRSIWTVGSDGKDAKRIIPNGHSPAWSRDGEQIAFMRAEPLREAPLRRARLPRLHGRPGRAPGRPGIPGRAGACSGCVIPSNRGLS